MKEQTPLFDVIRSQDLDPDKFEEQKQLLLNANWNHEKWKEEVIEDLDILFKIVQCKYRINKLLEEEDIFSIVEFLEENYYNQDELLKRINNILRFLFIPLYYRNDKEYTPHIPQEFWSTPLGKIIISCLSANDDILLSSTEAGQILNYKRQNMSVLANEGKLPVKRVGGNLVFRLFDVLTYKKKLINSKISNGD